MVRTVIPRNAPDDPEGLGCRDRSSSSATVCLISAVEPERRKSGFASKAASTCKAVASYAYVAAYPASIISAVKIAKRYSREKKNMRLAAAISAVGSSLLRTPTASAINIDPSAPANIPYSWPDKPIRLGTTLTTAVKLAYITICRFVEAGPATFGIIGTPAAS